MRTMTKDEQLTTEMMSQHDFEVATQNAVDSKTARSRHGTEVATQNLLRGQKNMAATKINIAGNRNDVAIYILAKGRTVRSRLEIEN